MLEELRKLKSPGTRDDIIYFLQKVIGTRKLSIKDINIICALAPGKYQLDVNELLKYCIFFNWIKKDINYYIDEKLREILYSNSKLNQKLVSLTINILFELEVFEPNLFYYDIGREKSIFRNEILPLQYSAVRNVLASQGFFDIERVEYTTFIISSDFEGIVEYYCKKFNVKITLAQLKRQIEKNSEIGELAENYVLNYEKKRLKYSELSKKISIISGKDVTAGYDIISYESNLDYNYNRFIEVKAISAKGFYWSENEMKTAGIKGSKYHLYLVELNKINDVGYEPIIITNPVESVLKSSDWLLEAQSYFVMKIQ